MVRRARWLMGLVVLGTPAFGCSQSKAPAPAAADSAPAHAGHGHGGGPHGGTIAEWGDEDYHVEFTVDHDQRKATVFILGPDAKSPTPIAAENVLLSIREPMFSIDLQPAPLDGESPGKASRFTGRNDQLGKVQEFAGTISAEVGGTPYAGDFSEQPRGHAH